VSALLRKYRMAAGVLVLNLLLWAASPALAQASARNTVGFLAEVLGIVPSVMLLMGLLEVWVPRALIEAHLGPGSGPRGAALAMLLGTAAAGPLYAAFPMALSLRNKGARTANIAIFLGAWATIKIPMLLMESSFIGLRFALLRLAFTAPGILLVGWLMERLAPGEAAQDLTAQELTAQDLAARKVEGRAG
jgi:Predicted permeases